MERGLDCDCSQPVWYDADANSDTHSNAYPDAYSYTDADPHTYSNAYSARGSHRRRERVDHA
jgi:hypothetical protein